MDISGAEETLDRLNPGWSIYQLSKGHRFSNDDIFTAWRASEALPDATRLLDLGSGVGSVGLSTLYRMRDARATLTLCEAQAVSHRLACKTVAHNGIEERVRLVHRDLRQFCDECEERFDLITGSPPYIPPGSCRPSKHPQKAHCRVELRGSVFDYCAAAKKLLAPGGRFVYVMAAQDERTFAAPPASGLRILERHDFTFKEGRAPHICTVVCCHAEEADSPRTAGAGPVHLGMTIRDGQARRTLHYRAWQEYMQLPVGTIGMEDLQGLLGALADAEGAALEAAVAAARAAGLRPSRGSELAAASERLAHRRAAGAAGAGRVQGPGGAEGQKV